MGFFVFYQVLYTNMIFLTKNYNAFSLYVAGEAKNRNTIKVNAVK